MNQDHVRRITTREKVALSERPEYRFQLWEVRESGERLLEGNVGLPRPDESSLSRSADTIATYFYY